MDNNSSSTIKKYQCHSCSRSFDYPYPVQVVQCLFCESQFCELEEEILKDIQKKAQQEEQRIPPPERLQIPQMPRINNRPMARISRSDNNQGPMMRLAEGAPGEDNVDQRSSQYFHYPRRLPPPRPDFDENGIPRQPPRIVRIQRIVEGPNGTFQIESRSMQREFPPPPHEQLLNIQEMFRRMLEMRRGENSDDYKAQEAFVQSLLRYKIGTDISLAELKLKEDVICCVCQDDYKEGEELIEMPCKHLFHSECLLPWLQKRRSCPNCRDKLGDD